MRLECRRWSAALPPMMAVAAITAAFLAGGATRPSFTSKFAGGDPDAVAANGRAQPGDEGPASLRGVPGCRARVSGRRDPAGFAAKARVDLRRNRGKGRQGRRSEGQGPQVGSSTARAENGTEPGVLAFSGATNNTASRTTALVIDPDCGSKGKGDCFVWIGASGGGVWRTNERVGEQPRVEPAQARAARPELGRRADARSDRQDEQHDLPGHRRAEPLLVRLRGRRRHLQVDRPRQQLEAARRHVREQCRVLLREPRRKRLPRPRDQGGRHRPER